MTEASTVFAHVEYDKTTNLLAVMEDLRGASIDGTEVAGVVIDMGSKDPTRLPHFLYDHCGNDDCGHLPTPPVMRTFGLTLILLGNVTDETMGDYWVGPHAIVTLVGRSFWDKPRGEITPLQPVRWAVGTSSARMLPYDTAARARGEMLPERGKP